MPAQDEHTLNNNGNPEHEKPENTSFPEGQEAQHLEMKEAGVDMPAGDSHAAVTHMESQLAEDSETSGKGDKEHDEDYSGLGFEELISAFKELVTDNEIQVIRNRVRRIKDIFYKKVAEDQAKAREIFLGQGGELKDFLYHNPHVKKFKEYERLYHEKNAEWRKKLEMNLMRKKEVIEELKNLLDEADTDSMFRKFKQLQKVWREIGPIPRENYSEIWKTYQFYVNRIYDWQKEHYKLYFNRNLEEKLKLVARAEELAQSDDVLSAYKELQILHRKWKEEIGPVPREHRAEIWEKFSEATRKIHIRKQELDETLSDEFEKNLKLKELIIKEIQKLLEVEEKEHHSFWMMQIKEFDKLRNAFFAVGPVPHKESDRVWEEFKTVIREFNRRKNQFFRRLKKAHKANIEKKKELIALAEQYKDSDDFDKVTEIMKDIQRQWKETGPTPKRVSEKLWKQFEEACNHYFTRLHEYQDKKNAEKFAIFEKKKDYYENLKNEFENNPGFNPDYELVKKFVKEWNEIGQVAQKQRYIDSKFFKLLDKISAKISEKKQGIEMLKYQMKIEGLLNEEDGKYKLNDEINFVRNKIETLEREKQLMENNAMMFFKNNKNPFAKETKSKIERLDKQLIIWHKKLEYLRKINK